MVGIVVDHHDGAARPGVIGDLAVGHPWARSVDARQHHPDGKDRALPGRARDGDVAAQRFGQQLGDGESQPKSRRQPVALRLPADERLVDMPQILRQDAVAGIVDDKARHLRPVADVKIDPPGIGELDGVGQEVDEDLPQPLLVGAHMHRQFAGPRVAEGQPLGFRLQPEHVDQLVEEIVDVDRVGIDLQPPGLDLGDIEQSVDQPRQVLGAAPDDLDRGLPLGRNGLVALEDLRVPEDRVERRAQFVTEANDVAALGPVGRLGVLLGLLQCRIGAAMGADFLEQQRRLPRTLLLGHPPAVIGEHQEPAGDRRHHAEDEKHHRDRAANHMRRLRRGARGELVDDEEAAAQSR